MFKQKLLPRSVMLLFFFIMIVLFSSVSLFSSSMALLASDRIFYGVEIAGMALGGLTKAEATEKLDKAYAEMFESHALVRLTGNGQSWNIYAPDIDFVPHTEAVAEAAYRVGREDNLLERFLARVRSAQSGVVIPLDFSYNRAKLSRQLSQIAQGASVDMQDAYCVFENNAVTAVPEKVGLSLDIESFMETLRQALEENAAPFSLSLPLAQKDPSVTAEDLKEIDCRLAVYTSTFNHYNVNRSENIKIAANSINRLLIRPGEQISFNDLVGLRVAAAGFKEAPVIIDGKTVPDIGGGVCQVSSTLYNAILLADLKPIERTPHFHPLGYVPIGLDATVADNLLDFQFKNSLNHNVYIIAEIFEGNLTITVLGSRADAPEGEITLTSTIDKVLPIKTVIEYDASLPNGKTIVKEDGLEGYIVSSYRIRSVNGKEVSRELLYTDEYTPEDKIVVVGSKKIAAPAVAKPKAAQSAPVPVPKTP